MHPFLRDSPSSCNVLLRIIAVNGIIMMWLVLFVGTGGTYVPNWDVCIAVATKVPIVEVLCWVGLVAHPLLLTLCQCWWYCSSLLCTLWYCSILNRGIGAVFSVLLRPPRLPPPRPLPARHLPPRLPFA